MKKLKKKRKHKSPLEKLQDKVENVWKLYHYKRDGRGCQVKRYFPNIPLPHNEVYQVDHCITRTNKHTFVMLTNGTVVCGCCNMAKGFNQGIVGKLIDKIVQMREGKKAWEHLLSEGARKDPCLWWKDPLALEQKIKEIEETTNNLTKKAEDETIQGVSEF